jgi:hypothetical protein
MIWSSKDFLDETAPDSWLRMLSQTSEEQQTDLSFDRNFIISLVDSVFPAPDSPEMSTTWLEDLQDVRRQEHKTQTYVFHMA